jgi:hypothetical protein
MTALPRGTCPVCGSEVALRKGNLVREHRRVVSERHPGWARPYWTRRVCEGSGQRACTETEYGRFKDVNRDGVDIYLFECPGCGQWAELDDDQWHGRVSVQHDCGYHETHEYLWALNHAVGMQAERPTE